MQIIAPNLRHTTRETCKPVRVFTITPKGGLTKVIEKKMPKENEVPKLWC